LSQDVNDRQSGPWTLEAGETGPHSFDFAIRAASELRVTRIRSGAETVLAYPADYTVSVASYPGTGTITLTASPAAGDVLVVEGLRPLDSPTSDETTERLVADKLNTKEDTSVRDRQELRRDIDHAVRAPRNESGIVIPSAAARANRVGAYDSAGDPVAGPYTSFLEALLNLNSDAEDWGLVTEAPEEIVDWGEVA
jgi:hypothetical protein